MRTLCSYKVLGLVLFMFVIATCGWNEVQAAGDPPASKVSPEAVSFFEKSIRPVLQERCVGCHGDKRQSSNLRLDSAAGLIKGGDQGAVIDKTALLNSRLLAVLRYTGEVKMPPAGKLPDKILADITAWVQQGAPWPDTGTLRVKNMSDRISEARSHLWSLQPIRKPTPKPVKNTAWAKTPIDRIVLVKLEAKGLGPAPPADRRTLIRRITYDLIGLPPTPSEIDAFLADRSPGAFGAVVDRLLGSPLYGERWGRHWLDVARYSDTQGYLVGNVGDAARLYPYAYTYRDYVVRALNADMPYNQFIKEQLAADLMNLSDKRDLAALGFLTVGNRYLGNEQEILDDRIDVVTRGLQAMTVGCARCHDHKFDPIPSADYYALYGVFNSIHEPAQLPQIGDPADPKAFALFLSKVTPLEQKCAELRKAKKDEEANKIGDQIKQITATDPGAPPRAMVVNDNDAPNEPHILLRGNPGTPGAAVPRQFLAAVEGEARRPFTHGSGRIDLAEHITSAENPLTARVIVNRVWMYHFGKPLVSTPSDFGTRGTPPVQPELLDYLAASLMEQGWSLKKLHRQILLSNMYQQSCDTTTAEVKADPENLLLGRMNRQRMDFEELRDTLLQLSGALDKSVGGRPLPALFESNSRRTLYAFVDRQDLPGVLRTFDFADPGAHSPMRSVTTVPQQALFLMNNPFVLKQVRGLLAASDLAGTNSTAVRIKSLFNQIFGRPPTSVQLASSTSFINGWKASPNVSETSGPAWQYGYGEYNSQAQRVQGFTLLPHFTGQAWQGGSQLPDPKIGWVLLRAEGGHPGDAQHCAIRRWTAPRDMAVTIQGVLTHPAQEGDGVEAMVVSNRVGRLGSWIAHHATRNTNVANVSVKRGDTLDFVVSSRENVNNDSFSWAPTIDSVNTYAADRGKNMHWDAAAEFSGPVAVEQHRPITAWEVYTQALLMTNEFLFID